MRGAEQTILPSATVQTEHPSVKSTQEGLSRTNSAMVAALSGTLSSAPAIEYGNAKNGGNSKTTRIKCRAEEPLMRNDWNIPERSFGKRIATFTVFQH
ncbi:hypothetical protein G6M16_004975 [Agrobacterium tumefaciens]|uniref:hypothetical protein n=1 Tax=Agrobacterium TaxID=357 RepID=UPI001574CFF6|nr:hypothetical protein G6M16_004975 [Agrobacterium tumefaciens]